MTGKAKPRNPMPKAEDIYKRRSRLIMEAVAAAKSAPPVIADSDELDALLRRLQELGAKPRFRVKAGSQRIEG